MAGRWRSEKVRRPREFVQPYVEQLSSELSHANPGLEFHFAGSWRREAPVIGDLDIVVVTPSGLLAPDLLDAGVLLPSFVTFQRLGSKVANGDVALPDGGLLHIDVWSCSPHERGAYLMFATGPMALNIHQRQHALRNGYRLSQVGLQRSSDHVQVDNGTEKHIYELLGLPYLTPAQRQRWAS